MDYHQGWIHSFPLFFYFSISENLWHLWVLEWNMTLRNSQTIFLSDAKWILKLTSNHCTCKIALRTISADKSRSPSECIIRIHVIFIFCSLSIWFEEGRNRPYTCRVCVFFFFFPLFLPLAPIVNFSLHHSVKFYYVLPENQIFACTYRQ